jgi:hypothetical protein
VGGGIVLAFAGGAAPAAASAGGGGHNPVTICHALGNGGYVMITPDASGVLSGHADHHGGADIIPPFSYQDKKGVVHEFAGQGDQSWLSNNCAYASDPEWT